MHLWPPTLKKVPPPFTAFVAAFNAKVLNDTELWKSCFAGGNRISQANQLKTLRLKI